MASLKEIKNRISSVRSTLKITSSMKMVASAKLHRAQSAVENMRPYEAELAEILRELQASAPGAASSLAVRPARVAEEESDVAEKPVVAIIAFSSNSSLCGGFNSNVIKAVRAKVEALAADGKDVVVYSVGRKMSEAMNRLGYQSPSDLNELVAHVSYDPAADLAQSMMDAFVEGKYETVYLVYNHFVSTSSQVPVCEQFLPMEAPAEVTSADAEACEYILEPSAAELLETLIPKVMKLKLYTAVLDSAAAEHAARTVAMQTASDNAENILGELTLEYNKSRQQKITSEILDLVGGSMLQ